MQILKWEFPHVVHVAFGPDDLRLLAQAIEPETFLEPGAHDARFEAVTAMQTAFEAMAEAVDRGAAIASRAVQGEVGA